MTYGPAEPARPPRNRHRWLPHDAGCERCSECFIVRRVDKHGTGTRWRDRMGEWHTGGIPQCR